MSDDDEMPELEDFTEQLKEISKAKGIDEKNIPKDIKIGVIDEKKNTSKEPIKENKVQIPITKTKTEEPPKKTVQDNKRDEDNFGCGLFKRGFLKRHNFSEDVPKKENKKENDNNKEKEKKMNQLILLI